MRTPLLLAALVLAACSGEAGARDPSLAIERAETSAAPPLLVTSPAFGPGGPIALRYSAYGEGVSPPLSWSALPAGTRSLALMVEDPDAVSAKPFVHWLAWNIGPGGRGLAEGGLPSGAVQGKNNRGTAGWFGPRPADARPHHYHFQLFALDRTLDLPAGAGREQLLAAMNGHVLAKGELVGVFARPKGR